jgi:hypothetical protein
LERLIARLQRAPLGVDDVLEDSLPEVRKHGLRRAPLGLLRMLILANPRSLFRLLELVASGPYWQDR